MEGLIGIAFKDYVLLAADRSMFFNIFSVKQDMDKMVQLDKHLVLAVSGEPGDTTQFAEFIEKNVKLYKMRNGFSLSPGPAADFVRHNLADSLRSRSAYSVNCLLAGYDAESGPALFYLDYLATCLRLPFAMHGYGAYFSTSILDRWYRPEAPLDEGLDLLRRVVQEVQRRLIVSLPAFSVVVVDKDGVRRLPDLKIDVASLGLPQ